MKFPLYVRVYRLEGQLDVGGSILRDVKVPFGLGTSRVLYGSYHHPLVGTVVEGSILRRVLTCKGFVVGRAAKSSCIFYYVRQKLLSIVDRPVIIDFLTEKFDNRW